MINIPIKLMLKAFNFVGHSARYLILKPLDFLLKNLLIYIFSKDQVLIKCIRFLDDKIIDQLKISTPASGLLIELELVKLLDKIKQVVLDKE